MHLKNLKLFCRNRNCSRTHQTHSRDTRIIDNYFINFVFSVSSTSYRSSFFLLRCSWPINQGGKTWFVTYSADSPLRGEGGKLTYKSEGGARRILKGLKTQVLVPLTSYLYGVKKFHQKILGTSWTFNSKSHTSTPSYLYRSTPHPPPPPPCNPDLD